MRDCDVKEWKIKINETLLKKNDGMNYKMWK